MLKAKIKGVFTGHILAMVTCCATELTATCSALIGQFVDTMILASTNKRVITMTHQTLVLTKVLETVFSHFNI